MIENLFYKLIVLYRIDSALLHFPSFVIFSWTLFLKRPEEKWFLLWRHPARENAVTKYSNWKFANKMKSIFRIILNLEQTIVGLNAVKFFQLRKGAKALVQVAVCCVNLIYKNFTCHSHDIIQNLFDYWFFPI